MLRLAPEGLYCPAGNFYVDPWRPVETAVITHAHGDHARPGSRLYHATDKSLPILRHRLGADAQLIGHAYREPFRLGDATVTLYPAGHVLGSAQVLIEHGGHRLVISGDYKRVRPHLHIARSRRLPPFSTTCQMPNMGIIMPTMGIKKSKRNPSPPANLADTLFSSTQQRVLGQLFGQPDRSFYASELIAAGGGSGAVQRELARLEASGLVESSRIGNQKHYQANHQSPIFEELRGIVRKTTGAASGLRVAETRSPAYVVKSHAHVGVVEIFRRLGVTRRTLTAFCRKRGIAKLSFFGSVTREDFGPDSDVDVKVEFEPGRVTGLGIVDVRDGLARLFGRPVDLLTNPVISNPIRRRSIERDLTVAYAAD